MSNKKLPWLQESFLKNGDSLSRKSLLTSYKSFMRTSMAYIEISWRTNLMVTVFMETLNIFKIYRSLINRAISGTSLSKLQKHQPLNACNADNGFVMNIKISLMAISTKIGKGYFSNSQMTLLLYYLADLRMVITNQTNNKCRGKSYFKI